MPTGPWLSTVYHTRACKRYYGLIRRSDELPPAWPCGLLWRVFARYPGRSPHLPFFSLTYFTSMPLPLTRRLTKFL